MRKLAVALIVVLSVVELGYSQRLCVGLGANMEQYFNKTYYGDLISGPNSPNFYVIQSTDPWFSLYWFPSVKYLLNDRDNFQINFIPGDVYDWDVQMLMPGATWIIGMGGTGVSAELLYQRNIIKGVGSCSGNSWFYVVGSSIFIDPYGKKRTDYLYPTPGDIAMGWDTLPVKIISKVPYAVVPMLQLGVGKRINISKNFFGEFMLYGNIGVLPVKKLIVSENNSVFRDWVVNYGNSVGLRFQLYWHKARKDK